jgi:hypothetical protein
MCVAFLVVFYLFLCLLACASTLKDLVPCNFMDANILKTVDGYCFLLPFVLVAGALSPTHTYTHVQFDVQGDFTLHTNCHTCSDLLD